MPTPMPEFPYGLTSVARPLVANVPDMPPGGGVKVRCDWCSQLCWQRAIEPNPMPPGYAPCCTECALRRATRQRQMDSERWAREHPV